MKHILSLLLLITLFTSCTNSDRSPSIGDTTIIGTGDVSDVIIIDLPTDPALDCCAVIIHTGTVLKNGVVPQYFDTATYHFTIDCQTIYFVSDADPSHPHTFPVNRGQCVWRERKTWAIRPK